MAPGICSASCWSCSVARQVGKRGREEDCTTCGCSPGPGRVTPGCDQRESPLPVHSSHTAKVAGGLGTVLVRLAHLRRETVARAVETRSRESSGKPDRGLQAAGDFGDAFVPTECGWQ